MRKGVGRVTDRGVNVLTRESRIGCEQLRFRGAVAQFAQDDLYGNPGVANNRLPGMIFGSISMRGVVK